MAPSHARRGCGGGAERCCPEHSTSPVLAGQHALRHRCQDPGEPMTFEYLADPGRGPKWTGLLPGAPEAYFLRRGEGEHSKLFTDLFTVLASGDETGGQFGIITSESP